MSENETNAPGNIKIKLIILERGNLLLRQVTIKGPHSGSHGKWCLIEGMVNSGEDLWPAIIREAGKETGWMVDDIRLLRINIYEPRILEPIFIVEAKTKLADKAAEIKELKWFPLTALPETDEIVLEDIENIEALAELVHKGKTFDFEAMPPVVTPAKAKHTKVADLLALPL